MRFLLMFKSEVTTFIYFSDMEHIGDKDAAIAERVRALLAAANSSSATASAALPPSVGAVPVPPPAAVPAGVRRLESATDPATVVANLTVAGIRYAVSYFDHFSAGWLYHRRWIRSQLWIRNVLSRHLLDGSIKFLSCHRADPKTFALYYRADPYHLKPDAVRTRTIFSFIRIRTCGYVL
jgi:hypothetical protein